MRRRDVWLESVCSQLLMSWRQGWSGIISSLYLTNSHLVSYQSHRKKWDRLTNREYFTRHNSKEMKPQINPGRQVRSGCDPTQNKLLLNRTKMHMLKHGDPSKAAYLDGFFPLSHYFKILTSKRQQKRFQHSSLFQPPKWQLSVVVYTISSKQLLYKFCWCAEHQTIDNSVSEQWPQRAKGVRGCRTAVLAGKPQNTCTVIQTLLFSQVLTPAGMEQRCNKKKNTGKLRSRTGWWKLWLPIFWTPAEYCVNVLSSQWVPRMLLIQKI